MRDFLRVVTLNTWKNEGDYFGRMRAIAAGLRDLQPDVVLLQEVFRIEGGFADTAADLARELGLALVYAPARRKLREWRGGARISESGLAILTRANVLKHEQFVLPSDERGGERVALIADLRAEHGRRIVACCTHLSHLRDDSAQRRRQLDTILRHPLWRLPADVRILGGDFNARPGSPELAWLEEHPTLQVRDVFHEAADAAPTHPMPPAAGRMPGRIDFLFAVGPRGEPLPDTRRAAVALDHAINGVWPSDHAAVVADLASAPWSAASQHHDELIAHDQS